MLPFHKYHVVICNQRDKLCSELFKLRCQKAAESKGSGRLPVACQEFAFLCISQSSLLLYNGGCGSHESLYSLGSERHSEDGPDESSPTRMYAQHGCWSPEIFCVLKCISPTLSNSHLNMQKFLLDRILGAFLLNGQWEENCSQLLRISFELGIPLCAWPHLIVTAIIIPTVLMRNPELREARLTLAGHSGSDSAQAFLLWSPCSFPFHWIAWRRAYCGFFKTT